MQQQRRHPCDRAVDGADDPQTRREAEEMLWEAAFVLSLTRRVKEAILGEGGRSKEAAGRGRVG